MNPAIEAAWIAAGVGGLGIVATAVTGIVTNIISRRAADANTKTWLKAADNAWLRDKRAEMYADLLTHLSWRQAELRRLTHDLDPNDRGTLPSNYQPGNWHELDARLLALAPVEVVTAVQQAMTCSGYAELAYNDWAQEGKPGQGPEREHALSKRQAFEDANDKVIEAVRVTLLGAGPPVPDWKAPAAGATG